MNGRGAAARRRREVEGNFVRSYRIGMISRQWFATSCLRCRGGHIMRLASCFARGKHLSISLFPQPAGSRVDRTSYWVCLLLHVSLSVYVYIVSPRWSTYLQQFLQAHFRSLQSALCAYFAGRRRVRPPSSSPILMPQENAKLTHHHVRTRSARIPRQHMSPAQTSAEHTSREEIK